MMSVRGDGNSGRIELKIDSDPANVASVRRAVEAFSGNCGFDEVSRGEIGLCVNEALANVIRHAYQGAAGRPITLWAEYGGDEMRISVRDWGSGRDPLEALPAQRDPHIPGGIGMICLRELMDSVRFVSQDDGMLLVMTRKKGRARPKRRSARDAG